MIIVLKTPKNDVLGNEKFLNVYKMEGKDKLNLRFVFPKWLGHNTRPVSSVDIHPSGELFATGGWNNLIKIWSFRALTDNTQNIKNKLLAVLRDHTKSVNIVRFSPDGKYLASGGDDAMMFIWHRVRCFGQPSTFGISEQELRPNHPVQRWQSKTFSGHTNDVTGISWFPDSLKIATCSIDGSVIVWDVKSANKLYQHQTAQSVGLVSISIDPLGKFIACQLLNGKLDIYDPTNNYSHEFGLEFTQPDQALVSRICWTPDGSFVGMTAANSGGYVTPFFSRESFNFGFMLEGHIAPSCCISCPPFLFRNKDGSYSSIMACGDKSGVISIWMVGEETRPLVVLDGVSTSTINDMCWSKDAKWLIVALENAPIMRQGGIVAFDFSQAHDLELVDAESMEEIRSHLIGENTFRVKSAAKTATAASLLHALDAEEKEVDLEVLQLTPQEVLARQVVNIQDKITYIQPVLLTAVEKQLVSFSAKVECEVTQPATTEYNPVGYNWPKPQILEGIVNNALDIGNFHIVSYAGSVIKLDKKTGRRLSTPYLVGGVCRHLSYDGGYILAVGSRCCVIDLKTMKEVMSCPCPSDFVSFRLAGEGNILANSRGRVWIWDSDFRRWIGGALSNDASDLTIEEIERSLTDNSVERFDLAITSVFNEFVGESNRTDEIIQALEENTGHEETQRFIDVLKNNLKKRWRGNPQE